MDWSQWLYVAVFLVAFGAAWWRDVFSRIILVVMLGNLIATMEAPHILWVGIADVVCAAVLLGRGRTANFVALIFALMVPLYVAAAYWGWPEGATFAIVDLMAYMQLGLIANGGGGNHRRTRAFNLGRFDFRRSVLLRRNSEIGVALDNRQDSQR